MSSAWEFVKRHKGKFIAAGAVVGAAVAAKSAIDADLLGLRDTAAHEVQLSQARRHFLFDAHQQSCDKALTEAILDIKQVLKSRYPVEQLVESLKDGTALSNADKIRIWEDIEHKSIARVVSTAFAYSLVIVASKTQKSIVCAETCNAIVNGAKNPAQVDVLTRLSTLVFGGAPQPQQSQTSPLQTDTRVQQVFINCIQFLTTSGLNQIFHTIDTIVEEQLVVFPLDKKVTAANIEELFSIVVQQVENLIGSRNYANFIVPQAGQRTLFDNSNGAKLEELLAKFVQVLELRRCRDIMQGFVRRFITGAVGFLQIDLPALEQPMAKCLPAIADAFTIIARNSHESAFQDCLHSSELHQFTLIAFTAESIEQTDVTPKPARNASHVGHRAGDDFALD
uniref:Peroxisomal biogenesis factor 3 n=1 Tax=Panagrellus redivivus TaxID=6233 RepID=A0A7E4UTB8_PANRE